MKPEIAFSHLYAKVVRSAEEALSSGSQRHLVVNENKELLEAVWEFFSNEGWRVERLDSKYTASHDYIGVLIIRYPLKDGN